MSRQTRMLRVVVPSLILCTGPGCTTPTKASMDSQDDTPVTSNDTATPTGGANNPSEGCGEDPTDVSTTLSIDGVSRKFELYLPSDYDQDREYPLVFAWHGLGGSGALAQYYFGLEQAAGSDAIIVYPDALPRADSGGETGWDLNPNGYDFEFFDAMVVEMTSNLCIDESLVFSTGHSFGGYMSNAMGCYRAEVHSAIAPVAGGPPYYGGCQGAVAAWITHGKNDDTVELLYGEQARDVWLHYNECSDSSEAVEPTSCVAYDGCSRDVHWCQHGGEHEWPSFAGNAIWSFFSAQ